MTELEKIKAELSELKQKITYLETQKALNENSKELWNIKQIAKYFGFTEEHTRRSIISDPRFPSPLDLKARTGGRCKKLYISGEVVRFAVRFKQKKPSIRVYC